MRYLLLCLLISSIFSPINTMAQEQPNPYSIEIDLLSRKLHVVNNKHLVESFPISIGTELSPTPIGHFKVVEKSKSWGGGFGSRWLGLNVTWGVYGIHGTNRPHLIGENISSGCIRMRNEHVEKIYDLIPIGTPVLIEGSITGVGEGEFKSLSKGSTGNLVQLVQNRLKAMGVYDGETDGIFGHETEDAVKSFQHEARVSVNGVVAFREYLLLGLLD